MTLEQKIKATEDYFKDKENKFKYYTTYPQDDMIDEPLRVVFLEELGMDDYQEFTIIDNINIEFEHNFYTSDGYGFPMKWVADLLKIWGEE